MVAGDLPKQRFGTLVVIIDKARNLPNRKKVGKQDAYAIVRLGHDVQRTPTDKRAGQVPSWNHEMRFVVPNEQETLLKISVFNEDSKAPDLIGDCAIDLSAIWRAHEYDSWFDLKYKGKPAGEIYAELTFYYEGPPRPKPKVALTPGPERAMSLEAVGSGTGMKHVSPGARDPLASFSELSLHAPTTAQLPQSAAQAHAYVPSPYQTGAQYADTWDGTRDTRVYTQPVGDLRRQSDAALQAQIAQELYGYVPPDLARAQAIEAPLQSQHRMASPSHEMAHAEMDARGRASPARSSSRLGQRSLGGPRPLPPAPVSPAGPAGQASQRHQHTQSHYWPREGYTAQGADVGLTQHTKAASLSAWPTHAAPGDVRQAAATGGSRIQQQQATHTSEADRYYREQHPRTYAPTPSRHAMQQQLGGRQLPSIPGQYQGPPRPQKVPLALTQAEYDLLYAEH